jgi:hypothetical protein
VRAFAKKDLVREITNNANHSYTSVDDINLNKIDIKHWPLAKKPDDQEMFLASIVVRWI